MSFDAQRWCELEPSRHVFDGAAVEHVVRGIVAESVGGALTRKSLARGWTSLALEHAVAQGLIASCGAWTAGFRNTRANGGPVGAYCCAQHSLLHAKDLDANESVARIVAGVREWRAFLEALAARFDVLHLRATDLPIETMVEHAAAELIELVVRETNADDAWHHTLSDVILWYLESVGHDRGVVAPVIERVLSWRFASWTAPSQRTREDAATELGLEIAIAVERDAVTVSAMDALSEWHAIRDTLLAVPEYPTAIPIAWDGHLRFIDDKEKKRDPERARRVRTALESSRASAMKGAPLTLALLEKWQAIVLGGDAPLRMGDAFAKDGRERYALTPSTQRRFSHWLEQANDTTVPVHVRAARVYFDVGFTHPFEDGNARASRLALDYVLFREGLVLRVVEPLFMISRAAGDEAGAAAFARSVSAWSGRAL